jgi:hypothetical protein
VLASLSNALAHCDEPQLGLLHMLTTERSVLLEANGLRQAASVFGELAHLVEREQTVRRRCAEQTRRHRDE